MPTKPETTVVKSVSVLILNSNMNFTDFNDGRMMHYRDSDYDAPSEDRSPCKQVLIPEQLYKDMGCPETITVTVQPGDYLNEEGKEE